MEHTLLLLHGEEIKDSSGKNVPLTNNGVQISTAQSKFGGKSLYFNGTGGIEFPSLKLGTADFTIDWWSYIDSEINQGSFLALYSGIPSKLIFFDGGFIKLYWNSSVRNINLTEQKTRQWVHYALVRSSGILVFFENGKKVYSANLPEAIPETNRLIGFRNGYSQHWKGYMDEFRVSNVARWTSDFTPPTEPYGALPDFSYKMQVPVGSSKKLYARLYPQNNDGYFQTDLKGAVVDITLTNP